MENKKCACGRVLIVPSWKTCQECDSLKEHERVLMRARRRCWLCRRKLPKFKGKFCSDRHRDEYRLIPPRV